MKFSVNQKDLQNSLNYCQGVIEKRSTLPILANVLLEAKNQNLKITATDLDLIFIQNISNIEISEEGETTTSCSIMYDIVRKFNNEKKIIFNLVSENKINVESDKSSFNLNCLKASEFPITEANFRDNEFTLNSKKLLKLLNKKRILLPVPLPLAEISARIFEIMPKPILTRDQLILLKYDNVLSGKYKSNFEIGVPSIKYFEKEVEKYCYMWREGGQFSTKKYVSKNNLQNKNT